MYALLHVKIKANAKFTGHDSIDLMNEVEDFVGNRPHKALIEVGKFISSSEEARKKYSESVYIRYYRKADAFIVTSMFTRLLINSYISFSKPKIPTRAFANTGDAIKWLDGIEI
jgi:hypothetical protein